MAAASDRRDRRHGDAQMKAEGLFRPAGHRCEGGATLFGESGGQGKASAVAGEDEGKVTPLQRVRDGSDDGSGDRVHRLVLPTFDGFGGPFDVGEADHPVVRQGMIDGGIGQTLEISLDRKAVEKGQSARPRRLRRAVGGLIAVVCHARSLCQCRRTVARAGPTRPAVLADTLRRCGGSRA